MKKTTKDLKLVTGLVVLLMGLLVISAGVSAENISNNQTTDTGTVCTPGETQFCIAGNECEGTQICNNNGSWEQCYTSLKKCVDQTCRATCPNGCTDECKESYCVGSAYYECVLSTGNGCYKSISLGTVKGKCGYTEQDMENTSTEIICNAGETKCEGSIYYSCENNQWQNMGEVAGKCGYQKPEDNNAANTNPTAPHFSSKAMSADDGNPGRIAVQVTNIMGNPGIDAQIILEVPDDVEVSGSVGALEGKASYNTLKLDIPAGGVTYMEIPFTAKNPGDYRMSATMYWKWKGDEHMHQIGFDHTVYINKNVGEVCIQKPDDEPCNKKETTTIPDPTSNQILFVVVGLLGVAVIIAVWRKLKVTIKGN